VVASEQKNPSLPGLTGQSSLLWRNVFLDAPVKPGHDGKGFETFEAEH